MPDGADAVGSGADAVRSDADADAVGSGADAVRSVADAVTVVERLARAATAAGEPPPFSDQTLVDVRAGRATVIGDEDGVAVVRDGELEVAVGLEARGRGVGTRLVSHVLTPGDGDGPAEPGSGQGTAERRGAVSGTWFRPGNDAPAPPRLAWAHGDHPGARALAARFGWTVTRTLLQLRATVPDVAAAPGHPEGWDLAAFRTGTDEAEWLALNAAAFADHPEQGRMTLDDLRARESDAWFDADDLLLLRDSSGALAGSCWLKVEDGVGEFYAVAVRPDLQGRGLGGVLMRAGWARLADRGIATAALYVEGDNAPALALYRRQGFVDHAVDVQYSAP